MSIMVLDGFAQTCRIPEFMQKLDGDANDDYTSAMKQNAVSCIRAIVCDGDGNGAARDSKRRGRY